MKQSVSILPWHMTIWQAFLERKQKNCLPHALLFSGIDGVGKKEFAKVVASYMLCTAPKQQIACGICHACHLQQAGNHPDFKWVMPEKNDQLIKVDQIREVVELVNTTSMRGGYRVIVFSPATAMNNNAANALLKTLEEPPANTLFILLCNQNLRLPATLSSRCQRIVFPKPDHALALAWLKTQTTEQNEETLSLLLNLTGDAPLQARAYISDGFLTLRQNLYAGLIQLSQQKADPLQFATQWEDKDALTLLNLLLAWLRDLLRCRVTGSTSAVLNTDYRDMFNKIMPKITHDSLLQYIEVVQQMYTHVLTLLNINRQLLLKEIFIRWMKLCI